MPSAENEWHRGSSTAGTDQNHVGADAASLTVAEGPEASAPDECVRGPVSCIASGSYS